VELRIEQSKMSSELNKNFCGRMKSIGKIKI
jgi:hypothetical protein